MPKSGFSNLMTHKWEYILPAGAFLLAFALRYHFLVTYHYPMMIHEQDAVGYMDVAKTILKFHVPGVAGRPPGYPLVIALFSLLPVGLEYAARLASIFMDALTVLPLYALARVYLDRIPAFAVSLLWACFSFSLYFSPSPLSQSSFLCYLLAGIVFLYHGLEHQENRALFWSGLFFALSFLTRPEGIVGFGCGLLLCLMPLFGKKITKSTMLLSITFLMGFFLLAGPYFVAFHSEFGYWGITGKTEAALKTQDGVLTLNSKGELDKTGAGESVWKAYYGTLPAFFSAVLLNIKAYFMVFYKTFPLWMHIISLGGMITLLSGRRARLIPYVLILVAVTGPNYIVNVSKTHSYLYSVFPAMFIFFSACFANSAKTAEWAIGKFRSTITPAACRAGLAVVLLLTVSYVAFGFYQEADASYQSPGLVNEAMITENIYKGAGEIIKSNSNTSDVIMTRWGLVGYFADRPVLTLPKGGVKEVIEYGRKHGARFVLIDTVSVLSRRQELRELLDPLAGKAVNPEYRVEVFSSQYFQDLGGYVIYRYLP